MSIVPGFCFRTVGWKNVVINDPLNTGMGSVFTALVGMENVRNTSFSDRFIQHIKHESCCVMQSNLPGNYFTSKSINDGCQVYPSTMKKEFSEITCPNDIRFDGRNALGSVWNTAHRPVAAIPRPFVTNAGLNAEFDHDPIDPVFTSVEGKGNSPVTICRMISQCFQNTITKKEIFCWSFWFVVQTGT